MDAPVSYAPMFEFGPDETKGNAQRFATYQEAYESAEHRFMVWTQPTGFTVEETSDPVNYRWSPVEFDVRLPEAADDE